MIKDQSAHIDYDFDGGATTGIRLHQVTQWDPTGRFPRIVKNDYGHWTETTYDAFGRRVRIEDINGQATDTEYDGLGRVVATHDRLRGLRSTTEIKDVAGSGVTGPQTVQPPSGSDGLMLTSRYYSRTQSDGAPPVATHYDRTGRVIRVIKEGFGTKKSYVDTVYNRKGEVVAVSTEYDPTAVEATRFWTRTTYDDLGRVATVTTPSGTLSTYTYKGRVTQVAVTGSDVPGGTQTQTSLVNVKGETIKVWNADNAPPALDEKGDPSVMGTTPSLEFQLDGFGRMIKTRTWQGNDRPAGIGPWVEITADYDALGNQTQLLDPDKGTWNYVYDALGRLRRQTDANLNVTTFTYDRLNRPLTRTTTEPDSGPVETATWSYYDSSLNAAKPGVVVDEPNQWIGAIQGESVSVTYPAAPSDRLRNYSTRTAYYYDRKGNPYLDLHQIDGKWFYRVTSFDALNRPTRTDHFWRPPGMENDYADTPYAWQSYGVITEYDHESYITKVRDSQGRTWWQPHATDGYDHQDRPILYQKGSGYWTQQGYSAQTGLLSFTNSGEPAGGLEVHWGIQRNEYSWDGLGNLTQRKDIKRAVSETFAYDVLNRLIQLNGDTIASYHDNGNIKSKASVNETVPQSYSYHSDRPHAVHTAHDRTMTYDTNGNLLRRDHGNNSLGVRWAGFDKPRWMINGSRTTATTAATGSAFTYGINRQRVVHYTVDKRTYSTLNDPFTWSPAHFSRKKLYVGSNMEVDYLNQSSSGDDWSVDEVRIYIPNGAKIRGFRGVF